MLRFALCFLIVLAGPVLADWKPDPADERQLASADSIERFRQAENRHVDALLAESYAFAVFPNMKRYSALLGWASGHGVLVEDGQFAGYVRQRRFSIGFQLGYQAQEQILLFRDPQAVDAFKDGMIKFTPQASARAGKAGGVADASFSSSVAVLSLGKRGLSIDAAVGGSRYRFTPAPARRAAGSSD